jgi:hypothetical protein
MRYIKATFVGVLRAIDWFIEALSTTHRPRSMDDANAKYGLDTLDSTGERMGHSGSRPGEGSRRD